MREGKRAWKPVCIVGALGLTWASAVALVAACNSKAPAGCPTITSSPPNVGLYPGQHRQRLDSAPRGRRGLRPRRDTRREIRARGGLGRRLFERSSALAVDRQRAGHAALAWQRDARYGVSRRDGGRFPRASSST